MTARTLKAVCFTLAITSSAICVAQQRSLNKDDLKKIVAQGQKRIDDCESRMNNIRIQGRRLGPSDFKRLEWYDYQIRYLDSRLKTLRRVSKRARFTFDTNERVCFDELRAVLSRKNEPPLSSLRFDKGKKLRPVKVKKTKKKPAPKKELTETEKELLELQRRKERILLELQAASANEEVQRHQQNILAARLERSRYEAAHEEWEQKLEALEKTGKATEVAKLEIKVKQAALLRSISKYRKEELESEYHMLVAQKKMLSAQAGLEKWERDHAPKARLIKVEVRRVEKHWVAAKLKLTAMNAFEKDLENLFKWCVGKKLNPKGPVVSYYPRFFDGARKMDKLGLGVILAGDVEASKDDNYAVESVRPTRVLSIHVRGPYEKSMNKLGEALAILKKKKLKPLGPIVVYYHSDPNKVEAEDLHTEITIPVEED